MKNLNKKAIRQAILNYMKNDSYTKKEEIYAHLIIKVMEEANKFGKKLDNVYVNHNIIEGILLSDFIETYLHDNFGRSKEEFSPEFITACNKLKEQFDMDYPHAESFINNRTLYYTSMCFGVRIFMRKVISRIVFPLGIEVKVQPIFVSLNIYNEDMLNVRWFSGKKYGHYFLQDDFPISRKPSKSELRLLENQINAALKSHGYEVEEFEELMDFVDSIIYKTVSIGYAA